MKKLLAILLIAGLVLGSMSTAAFAKNQSYKSDTKNKLQYSIYEFDYDLPENLLADKDIEVGVTFQTKAKGLKGYDDVRFNIDSECLGTTDQKNDGQVTLSAKDSQGNAVIIINGGIWGPEEGFDLPAEYEATTDWTLNFSKEGTYKITFELIDKHGDIINETAKSVTVKVVDSIFSVKVPKKAVEGKAVDLAVTLETQQDYDNDVSLEYVVEGPGEVNFKEVGTNNWTATEDGGYWNADIDDSYNKQTNWDVTFGKEGRYTITFRLVSKDKTLVEDSIKIDVLDEDGCGSDDEEDDEDECASA